MEQISKSSEKIQNRQRDNSNWSSLGCDPDRLPGAATLGIMINVVLMGRTQHCTHIVSEIQISLCSHVFLLGNYVLYFTIHTTNH